MKKTEPRGPKKVTILLPFDLWREASIRVLDEDSSLQEVIVDGPAFRIVTKDRDAWVIIAPYAPLNPPLHQAAGQLMSVVSGCASSISPRIEQHDF